MKFVWVGFFISLCYICLLLILYPASIIPSTFLPMKILGRYEVVMLQLGIIENYNENMTMRMIRQFSHYTVLSHAIGIHINESCITWRCVTGCQRVAELPVGPFSNCIYIIGHFGIAIVMTMYKRNVQTTVERKRARCEWLPLTMKSLIWKELIHSFSLFM